MRPESRKYLQDILDAARAIQGYVRGKSEQDYQADRALRDAVQWNFSVIGEALAQMKRQDEATAEQITDHWKIIGFRNQLIHGYGAINHDITWRIATDKLPKLIEEVEELRKS